MVADTKTSEVVSAVVPVSNSKAPSEGFECVGCGRRYTIKVPNPDDTKFQTQGWPTAADGSKVLCDKKTFPEKLTAYAEHRKGVNTMKNPGNITNCCNHTVLFPLSERSFRGDRLRSKGG